jgi:nitroreductase
MDTLETLLGRQSPVKLTDPAPLGAALDRIIEAGARAPDHGKLRPWRFVIIEGRGRAAFGDLLAETLARREPGVPGPLLEKEREKAMRAPLIIAVAARVQPEHPKIPVIEQVLSAGAAAQNMILAAHALGFGAMWKTGAPAYDDAVKTALGLVPTDQIVGFLYLGTIEMAGPPLRRPDPASFVVRWQGEPAVSGA